LVRNRKELEVKEGNKLSRGSVMISPSRDERTDLIFEISLKM